MNKRHHLLPHWIPLSSPAHYSLLSLSLSLSLCSPLAPPPRGATATHPSAYLAHVAVKSDFLNASFIDSLMRFCDSNIVRAFSDINPIIISLQQTRNELIAPWFSHRKLAGFAANQTFRFFFLSSFCFSFFVAFVFYLFRTQSPVLYLGLCLRRSVMSILSFYHNKSGFNWSNHYSFASSWPVSPSSSSHLVLAICFNFLSLNPTMFLIQSNPDYILHLNRSIDPASLLLKQRWL